MQTSFREWARNCLCLIFGLYNKTKSSGEILGLITNVIAKTWCPLTFQNEIIMTLLSPTNTRMFLNDLKDGTRVDYRMEHFGLLPILSMSSWFSMT